MSQLSRLIQTFLRGVALNSGSRDCNLLLIPRQPRAGESCVEGAAPLKPLTLGLSELRGLYIFLSIPTDKREFMAR